MKIIIGSFLLLALGHASASVIAPELTGNHSLASAESGWQIRAAIYGWGTALDGDVTLRGNNAPVNASFEDILDKLDFAFMGAVEVSNGKWGVLSDLFYAELSVSNTQGNRSFSSEFSQFIGNFVITRNLMDDKKTRLDIYAGARVNSLGASLDIQTNFIGTFSGSDEKSWVDPIIGVRVQRELPNAFFVRMVGDIGGFGVSSESTWQALAGLGYHLNDSSSVMLGYRGLGTDYQDGQFGYNVISHGLLLGYECKF